MSAQVREKATLRCHFKPVTAVCTRMVGSLGGRLPAPHCPALPRTAPHCSAMPCPALPCAVLFCLALRPLPCSQPTLALPYAWECSTLGVFNVVVCAPQLVSFADTPQEYALHVLGWCLPKSDNTEAGAASAFRRR